MDGFYLLKPDMLQDKESMEYYLKYMSECGYVTLKNFYLVKDFITLTKMLYEVECDKVSLEELRKIRSQMIVTIKGYCELFRDQVALISTIDILDDSKLQELYDFKKSFRKMFVLPTRKNYIRFSEEIGLEKRLIDINLDSIGCDIVSVEHDQEFEENGYHMMYINKIHFPDPSKEAIEKDLGIVRKLGITSDKNEVDIRWFI